MTEVILTIGVPGSGKSTWADRMAINGYAQVERDQLRMELYGKWYGSDIDEKRITAVQIERLKDYVKSGHNVIISDTNINPQTRQKFADLCKSMGADYQEYHVAPKALLDTLLDQNKYRGDSSKIVPVNVLERMYVEYREQFPIMAPNFDRKKPDAFVFDIDGTVANMDNVRGPFDWKKVGLDRPHMDVIRLLNLLHTAGHELIAVSGRDEICRQETADWLNYYGIPYSGLHMRSKNSQVKDSAVKHDLYHKYIAPKYNVLGVFDDRDQVVKTWRSMGLRCYQVAPGNF